MVVDQVSGADVDRIFHALADGTRRDILAHAFGARCSVSALAKRYPMSFAAVQKHVTVLEEAGLVTKERRGASSSCAPTSTPSGGPGRSWTASRDCGGRGWTGSTTSWQPRSELLETTDERY